MTELYARMVENLFRHVDGDPKSLARCAEESANETYRSSLFAQATYHTLIDIAQAIHLPHTEKDFTHSITLYYDGLSLAQEPLRSAKFAEATYFLGKAIAVHKVKEALISALD